MKILTVSTRDISGGAALAAYRFHREYADLGLEATMLVGEKKSDDKSVIECRNRSTAIKSKLEHVPLRMINMTDRNISFFTNGVINEIRKENPDVVHLHWFHNAFLSIEELLEIQKPIIWTMHDMWAFSDARHYVLESEAPEYRSSFIIDKWVWKRKFDVYKKLKNVVFVSPSKWLSTCAGGSILLKDQQVMTIANGVDTKFFVPFEKKELRIKYGLSKDDYIILYVGENINDQRKGFDFFVKALRSISIERDNKIVVAVAGHPGPTVLDSIENVRVVYFGKVENQEKMKDIFSLSNLLVLPTMIDNLPNTLVEAFACGCPAISFDVGGVSDIIDDGSNGLLIDPKDYIALGKGVIWMIENASKIDFSENARRKAIEKFDLNQQAKAYLELFNGLLAKQE
ncbi:glycosyltransferase [Reichenbachiella ulvae]|uniref:Glycosyltransferase n=1 Tax=Reichenbachiella ulvae TaxID=2980104 RepID=A0ABT3CYB8_9BACT|nr:glycosyltransferase [Reichenbachiella ulvae]MCV9388485.1 glycosyltransferase [Reichenbachiella ulvae]